MKTVTITFFSVLLFFQSNAQVDSSYVTASLNPFATTTDLTIHNLDADTVTVNVLSVVGSNVGALLDSVITINDTTITFDGSALPDGVYFVQLIVNNEQRAMKLIKSSSATSISEYNTSSYYPIYPNPVSSILTIDTKNNTNKIIRLFDVNGKLLEEQDKSAQQFQFDMREYDKAIYFLSIETNGKTVLKQVVKH